MGKPIDALQKGIRYQNHIFWLRASEMLHENSNIAAVIYEDDQAKSFDDVVVEYIIPEIGDYGLEDIRVTHDFYQVKYHIKNNEQIELLDLIEPTFINATSFSFLQRVQEAIEDGFTKARFHIFTPWNIKKGDVLEKLIDNHHHKFLLDLLFDGKQKSNMSKNRNKLKAHLNVDDEGLRSILSRVRINHSQQSIDILVRDTLNSNFKVAGLIPIDFTSQINKYNELISNCSINNNKRFNANQLLEVCKQENLYIGHNFFRSNEFSVGIRSFMRFAENLEVNHLLCVSDHFDNRHLKVERNWDNDISLKLRSFVEETFAVGNTYYIQFNAHNSITFATGLLLPSKSGSKVFPVQRGDGLVAWIPNIHYEKKDYSKIDVEKQTFAVDDENVLPDTIVCIGITHDINEHVSEYLKESDLTIGQRYNFSLLTEGNKAIDNGTHAWLLAEEVMRVLNTRLPSQRKGKVHLFMAAPAGFVFFLGQQAINLPDVVLYEHDFTGDYTYSQSFSLPFK